MAEISDDRLVELIRGGDTASFAVIVERYQLQVYNLMYRFSGSPEDAADLAQELFCRAYERLDRYREHTSFFSWLYTMALNQARDWARKNSRDGRKIRAFTAEREDGGIPSPAVAAEARQEREGLHDALDSLADDRREMVMLRYRHDRPIREIAAIFGLSESAVKMRLQRALGDLARHMKR